MLNDGLRFHGAVCAYDQIRHIANMASLRMLEAMMLVGRIKMPTGRFEIPMFDRVLMYMEPMLTWCEAGCGDLHLHPVIGLLKIAEPADSPPHCTAGLQDAPEIPS